ncbi:MAG: hypothetical protein M3328_09310, partial [Chloroflexota bacterium]|nr:hypothetical protein [Chloroflexota bacterium]
MFCFDWKAKYLVSPLVVAVLLWLLVPLGTSHDAQTDAALQAPSGALGATTSAVKLPLDSRRGQFPYGVYGLDERDRDPIYSYRYTAGYTSPTGDIDPYSLMNAIQSDTVYNLALSSRLGSITIEDKIVRTLQGAQ